MSKGAWKGGHMEFGVHLPLLAFRGQAFSLSRLVDYAEAAELALPRCAPTLPHRHSSLAR